MPQINYHLQSQLDASPIPQCNISGRQVEPVVTAFDVQTDNQGNFHAALGAGIYDMTYSKSGFLTRTIRSAYGNDYNDNVALTPGDNQSTVLEHISISGNLFSNGWLYRGCTDFSLPKLYDSGVDIVPILLDRQSVSSKPLVLRMLMMMNWGSFYQFPLNKVRPLADLVNKYHYGEFCVLQDCDGILSVQQQQDYFYGVSNALAGTNNLVDLSNERNHGGTNVNPRNFSKPNIPGLLFSAGSTTQDKTPDGPYWDWQAYHPYRSPIEKAIMQCAAWEATFGFGGSIVQIPWIANEILKYTVDTNDPDVYRRIGNTGKSLNGVNGHTPSGLSSIIFNNAERVGLIQLYKGMD